MNIPSHACIKSHSSKEMIVYTLASLNSRDDYPLQETSSSSLIPDSMTVVFSWGEWKCSLKDNRYFPEVFSVQESGLNKPDQLS